MATGAVMVRGREPAILTERREPADGGTLSSKFADLILYAVLAGFLVQVSVNIYSSGARALQVVMGVLCFAAVCALQILHSQPRSRDGRSGYRVATLTAHVLLTYVPLEWLGKTWWVAGGFLAASVLLLLPPPLSWPLFLAVVAANPVMAVLRHSGTPFVVYTMSSTLVTGLLVYAVSRMAWLVSELRRSRMKLVGAVSQERLRFARDLHDLLGYSLSAITLKTEVAIRHVPHRHEQVKEELTSILAISRQALTDVRHVARSYQTLSLGTELESCVTMLESSAIEVEAQMSAPLPDGQTGTVLAIVLREAVTNMLRHSKVQHCVIRLDRVDRRLRLVIVNDGTGLEAPDDGLAPPPTAWPDSGGLVNMETRLATVGGTLTAGLRPGGRFEVVAEVPDAHGTPTAGAGDGPSGADTGDGTASRNGTVSGFANGAGGSAARGLNRAEFHGGPEARHTRLGRRGNAGPIPAPRKYPDALREHGVRQAPAFGRPAPHADRDLGPHKRASRE
jgi:two-component system sensor histidine kinase DesK